MAESIKILKVPFFNRGEDKYSVCWASCIRMIRKFYDANNSDTLCDIINEANKNNNCKDAILSLNILLVQKMLSQKLTALSFDTLKDYIDKGIPLVTSQDKGHAVVIVGYYHDNEQQYLFFHSPAGIYDYYCAYDYNPIPECAPKEHLSTDYYLIDKSHDIVNGGFRTNTFVYLKLIKYIIQNQLDFFSNENAIMKLKRSEDIVFIRKIYECNFWEGGKDNTNINSVPISEREIINFDFKYLGYLEIQKFCESWRTYATKFVTRKFKIEIVFENKTLVLLPKNADDEQNLQSIEVISETKLEGKYELLEFVFLQCKFYRFKNGESNFYLIPVQNYTDFQTQTVYEENDVLNILKKKYPFIC